MLSEWKYCQYGNFKSFILLFITWCVMCLVPKAWQLSWAQVLCIIMIKLTWFVWILPKHFRFHGKRWVCFFFLVKKGKRCVVVQLWLNVNDVKISWICVSFLCPCFFLLKLKLSMSCQWTRMESFNCSHLSVQIVCFQH